jgi:hypothetical protein
MSDPRRGELGSINLMVEICRISVIQTFALCTPLGRNRISTGSDFQSTASPFSVCEVTNALGTAKGLADL